LKYDKVLAKNVHEVHLFLAHRIEKKKLKAEIMKPKSDKDIQL